MKKYPYSLIVRKIILCACSDLLEKIRPALPYEAAENTQVAPIKGAGPMLIEYSLCKRWPETKKDRKKQFLGRILLLKKDFTIVFHKASTWRIEIRDSAGNIVDKCKRNDKPDQIREKIKFYLEKVYPHYKNFNLSERFVETLMKPYRDIWMDFVDISKKALYPLCDKSEVPQLFWDFGSHVFFFGGDLEIHTAKESGLCWLSRTKYSINLDYFLEKGNGDWLWLHNNTSDKGLRLRPLGHENFRSQYGAFEIIFKAPRNYGMDGTP